MTARAQKRFSLIRTRRPIRRSRRRVSMAIRGIRRWAGLDVRPGVTNGAPDGTACVGEWFGLTVRGFAGSRFADGWLGPYRSELPYIGFGSEEESHPELGERPFPALADGLAEPGNPGCCRRRRRRRRAASGWSGSSRPPTASNRGFLSDGALSGGTASHRTATGGCGTRPWCPAFGLQAVGDDRNPPAECRTRARNAAAPGSGIAPFCDPRRPALGRVAETDALDLILEVADDGFVSVEDDSPGSGARFTACCSTARPRRGRPQRARVILGGPLHPLDVVWQRGRRGRRRSRYPARRRPRQGRRSGDRRLTLGLTSGEGTHPRRKRAATAAQPCNSPGSPRRKAASFGGSVAKDSLSRLGEAARKRALSALRRRTHVPATARAPVVASSRRGQFVSCNRQRSVPDTLLPCDLTP